MNFNNNPTEDSRDVKKKDFYVSQTINGKDAFETSPFIPYCYRKRLYFEPEENLWVVTKLHDGKILAYGNNWKGEGEGYGCPQDPGTEKTWYQGDFNVGKGLKMIDLEFISSNSTNALAEALIFSSGKLCKMNTCSNSSTRLNITWAWASSKMDAMSKATFNGFGIVCPCILCAVIVLGLYLD